MKYSFVIPVYNRPDEVDELLESLCSQEQRDFEAVVVEDGSSVPCEEVVKRYADKLDVHYFSKPNSGPGQTRNYGVERAKGDYVIILDSDVVVPPGYLAAVDAELTAAPCDAFGGPDRALRRLPDRYPGDDPKNWKPQPAPLPGQPLAHPGSAHRLR